MSAAVTRDRDTTAVISHVPVEALNYRPDIDGLRAIAILTVLVFHAFPHVLTGGFVGVDVFFVISGYLICGIVLAGLRTSTFSLATFYARRARRIFPSLAVVLLATLVAGAWVLLPDRFATLGAHAVAGAGFVSNLLLARESGYFDVASASNPLLHLWSLGIEEQFYIVWPLLLWAIWKIRRVHAAAIVIGVLVASYAWNLHLTRHDPHLAFFSPLTRCWELLCGCALAFFPEPFRQPSTSGNGIDAAPTATNARLWWLENSASLAGFALIAGAAILLDREQRFPGWRAAVPVVGATLLIAAGPRAWINRWLLATRPMVAIGLISFQLYLWHWPLLAFAHLMAGGDASASVDAAAVATSFPLAWVTYAFVDKPLRLGRARRRMTLIACGALAASAAAGLAVYALDGLPGRFPADIARLSAYRYDYAAEYREGTCFLRPEQAAPEFGDCTDRSAPAQSRRIFLWGDSHAAHLYPGLSETLAGKAALTQLTASSCPPLLDVVSTLRPHCNGINAHVMQRIVAESPDEVILSAALAPADWRRLNATIEQIYAAGVRKVVVVGPVPVFRGELPVVMSRLFNQDPMHRLPKRVPGTPDPITLAEDKDMAAYFSATQVTYVSALAALCDADGCLARTGPGVDSLTVWDNAHLTAAGSRALVAAFPTDVMSGKALPRVVQVRHDADATDQRK